MLTIKLPDETGELVEYFPHGYVARVSGVDTSTLSRWARAGVVRFRELKRRHYALQDVFYLLLTPASPETRRTPDEENRRFRERVASTQRETLPALVWHEPWDTLETCNLVDHILAGGTAKNYALKTGRTYFAVARKVWDLECEGELPRRERPGADEILARAASVLSGDEFQKLTERLRQEEAAA